jgi:hypothetical protein
MGLLDLYCGSNTHLIPSVRNAICKKWDEEHRQTPEPEPAPTTAPAPAPAPSSTAAPSKPTSTTTKTTTAATTTATTSAKGSVTPAVAAAPTKSSKSQDEQAAELLEAIRRAEENGELGNGNNNDVSYSPTSGISVSEGQTIGDGADTGSMAGVYAGIAVAAVVAVALVAFMFIHIARRRRLEQERALADLGNRDGMDVASVKTPVSLSRSGSLYTPSESASRLEAGRRTPLEMANTRVPPPVLVPMPVPVHESTSPSPPVISGPNDFLFDASQDMCAAGLGETSNPAPYGSPALGATDPIMNHYVDANMSAVMPSHDRTSIATLHVPDDVFGEPIYGDTTTATNNVVHAADLSTATHNGAAYVHATEEYPELKPASR